MQWSQRRTFVYQFSVVAAPKSPRPARQRETTAFINFSNRFVRGPLGLAAVKHEQREEVRRQRIAEFRLHRDIKLRDHRKIKEHQLSLYRGPEIDRGKARQDGVAKGEALRHIGREQGRAKMRATAASERLDEEGRHKNLTIGERYVQALAEGWASEFLETLKHH